MAINRADYPLTVLRDIKTLKSELKKLVTKYSDLIEEEKNENYLVRLLGKGEFSKFHFTVSSPNQTADYMTYFNFTYTPEDEKKLKHVSSHNNSITEIIKHFDVWIGLLTEYSTTTIEPEDYFTQQYEEEFYQEFEIVDEDADFKAFDHKRQIVIYELLSVIETKLIEIKPADTQIAEIIEDTKTLKENIQNLTKRMVVKKLSRIFAKIKKHGIPLIKEFWDEVKKEFYKQLIKGGFDSAGDIFRHLH